VAFSKALDGVETPRSYFRRHLAENSASPSDLSWYFEQALPHVGESAEVLLAAEELVDRLAQLVGFRVERDDSGSAAWTSPTGHQLLVWIVDRAGAVAAIAAASRARDARLVSEHVTPWTDVTCLILVCGPVNQRGPGDALVLRRAGDHQRFSTVDALRTLAGLYERGVVSHEQLLAVLKPPSAFADPLVALLDRVADRHTPSSNEDAAQEREDRR
jgi:hypothetical protein